MNAHGYRFAKLILFPIVALLSCIGSAVGGTVVGTIYDVESGAPIPYATVREESSGHSMSANQDGQFRLKLPAGNHTLKCSHLAYYSEVKDIRVPDSLIVCDVYLRLSRIVVPGVRVTASGLGPGQRIIKEAISRKSQILSKVRSYTFEAYTKAVVRKEGKADSTSIAFIVETQVKCNWEAPGLYKETILSRRRTANVEGIDVFATVGELLNFNENEIDIADHAIVSPTADNALDYYDFFLLDTISVDNRPVFRLDVEPQTENLPLFRGEMLIADSTYDVVGVDFGFNGAFSPELFRNPRFSQRYAVFQNDFWMPVEMRFDAEVDLPIPGVKRFFINFVAVMHRYEFNLEHPKDTFDEYVLEISENADKFDSIKWDAGQLVPLTQQESGGYKRIDSIAHAPVPLRKRAIQLSIMGLMYATDSYDFFHFSRVEGTYAGAALKLRVPIARTNLRLRSGYAFSGKFWEHDYGFTTTVSERRKLQVSLGYHDLIARRPTIISSPDANPTVWAACFRIDPLDYFHETGFDAGISAKLVNRTRISIGYHDLNQHSVSNNTEFSVFEGHKEHRDNPSINDGKMRALSARFTFDSRNLMKFRRNDVIEAANEYVVGEAGVETASPTFIENDFDYARYYVRLLGKVRTYRYGSLAAMVYAGTSDRLLPPQRFFTVDYGASVILEDLSFKTLGERNFVGDRAAVVYALHDFGTVFRQSGLPLFEKLPFTFSLFGGTFWTDFKNEDARPAYQVLTAERVYSEIGFQIGRILPIGLKLNFAWRLSKHDTDNFDIGFGIDLFR
jgi:hypothetical protein